MQSYCIKKTKKVKESGKERTEAYEKKNCNRQTICKM